MNLHHQGRVHLVLLALSLVLFCTEAHAQKPAPINKAKASPLEGKVNAIISRAGLKKAQIGIVIRSLKTDKVLYQKNPRLRMHPASNTKLVTTAAALDLLGPQFRWETQLAVDKIDRGVARNAYLIGRGDPRFVNESLWSLINTARENGLKRVQGDLIVDDSYFTSDVMAPGFDDKDQDSAYRAASGAMSINFNSIQITIRPGKNVGSRPRISVKPDSGHVLIKNQAKTTSGKRDQLSLKASEAKGRTQITLRGTIGRAHRGLSVRRRIDHPAQFAGDAAKLFLRQAGIRVDGRVKRGTAPGKRRRLARLRSRPLSLIVQDINKLSNNFMAEQVLRTIGVVQKKRGDWKQSAKAVGEYLKTRFNLDGFTYVNGSGLFGNTAFSAHEMTSILSTMASDSPPQTEFMASLAVSRVDGTLRKRFRSWPKGAVRGKTGTLAGVVCLSGYLYTQDGDTLVFSILMNDVGGKGWVVWSVQEKILGLFSGYKNKTKK